MAGIILSNVSKLYDNRVLAVDKINLDIRDGEFMALLGPSGCGKSSTMRMIAGLEEITDGEVWFDGRRINDVRPRERNVAMVFETYALYPTLSVYENIAFPLRSAGWDDADVKRRVEEIVEILEIENILARKPGQLSSGQAQLVGLGRALTRKPSVFVMDEPISHLDTRQRSRMRSYIKRLHIELGYTMIYVTHDQEEAMALADRIAIMHEGRLRQVGSPQEVFHKPEDLFVAGFVGEPPMNFMRCRLEKKGETLALFFQAYELPLPDGVAGLDANQMLPDEVVIGVRPFYIELHEQKPTNRSIPAEVYVVESMGDSTVVTAERGDSRLQIVIEAEVDLQPGDEVWLSFDPSHMLIFDAGSEKQLVR